MSAGQEKTYICVDLKSFYASVECVERELDPLTTKLVVADPARGHKTICLAITPAMKALGIKNRCRIFEIPEGINYIKAKPQMRRYMEASADIYATYLQFVSPQDIHVYSIDECFIDATPYLSLYGMDAHSFAKLLIKTVLDQTKIPATAGIGSNLFLAKVALDVTAKRTHDGIGFLDEQSFRNEIWFHQPITDIWSIGPGIAKRLAKYGAHDLAGVAALRPETLHKEFGVNAEYLIDHAWGQEPCTIDQIQGYEAEGHSMTNGQVLPGNYTFDEARMVLQEMVDASVLELVELGLVTDRISIHIGYAKTASSKKPTEFFEGGHGKRAVGGRGSFEHTGGSRKIERRTNSRKLLVERFKALYDETTRTDAPIRRIHLGFGDLVPEEYATFTLFDDVEAEAQEHKLQETLIAVRDKFGKNAMLKGISLKDKATARERNEQIGGHHA